MRDNTMNNIEDLENAIIEILEIITKNNNTIFPF
jgi:hypothetical protein